MGDKEKEINHEVWAVLTAEGQLAAISRRIWGFLRYGAALQSVRFF